MIGLSPNLTLSQFTATSHREFLTQQSSPPVDIIANARRLAIDLWEPAVFLLGNLHVNSGYRCMQLNYAIGGASNSAHCDGRAIDFKPLEVSLTSAIAKLMASKIPYDKLIWEFGRWLHMQAPKHGATARRLVLMTHDSVHYPVFNADLIHEV